MNRKTYQPSRCKQAALVFFSLILSISGCGCSGPHEHYASHVDCDEMVCKDQIRPDKRDSATFGGPMRTLVETR